MSDKRNSLLFIVLTLTLSWGYAVYVFSNPEKLQLFVLAMFIPGIVALTLNFIRFRSFKRVFEPVTARMNLKSILFSVVYPLAFIVLLAVLTKLTGLATVDAGNLPALASFPWGETLILSFLLMFGEEYGWRGFLLKNLAEAKGKAAAAMIVGAVWAVWHAPVIYGLARVSKMGHPLLLMFIQMGAVFAFSIPFAYAYFLSRSIIPPMLFHLLWNHYNSIVFGSIYRNSHGVMKGDLLLINGEGLGGMVLGALLMLWFMRRFRKMS